MNKYIKPRAIVGDIVSVEVELPKLEPDSKTGEPKATARSVESTNSTMSTDAQQRSVSVFGMEKLVTVRRRT